MEKQQKKSFENVLSKYSISSIFILAIILLVPINMLFDKFVIEYHEEGHMGACESNNVSCEKVNIYLSDSEIESISLRGIFTLIPQDALVEVRPNISEWCPLSKSAKQEIRLGGIHHDFRVISFIVALEFIILLLLLLLWLRECNKKSALAAYLCLILILIAITLSFMLTKQLIQFNYHLIDEGSDLFYFVCS